MEKPCTLLVHFDKGSPSMANEIKAELESGDGPAKADAMRRAISLLLNGEPLPHLFITVVRYVQSCDDHAVQKLLLLYLETVDKRDAATGKVLPEMILICQNLRNNLQSPNEYIRGATLRFLCRLAETGLLEPLVPSVLCTCALWILGEYSLSLAEVESAISTIKQCLGELPFYTISEEGEATDSSKPAQPVVNSVTVSSRRPAVLADGTYATQSAATESAISAPAAALGSMASSQNLRSLVLSGDFFLAAVVACNLKKLVLRLEEVQPAKAEVNKACTGALLIMVSILQLGQSSYLSH